jgi:hypothetical protein
MQTDSQTASNGSHAQVSAHPRKTEDLIYQALTVVAALMLLGSLWAF